MKKVIVLLVSLLMLTAVSAKEKIYKTDLKVSNLTCGSCLYKINSELKKLDGYLKMGGSLFKGEVYVAHRENLKAKTIEKTVNKSGYPAKIIGSNLFDMKNSFKNGNNRSCCGSSYCGAQNQ